MILTLQFLTPENTSYSNLTLDKISVSPTPFAYTVWRVFPIFPLTHQCKHTSSQVFSLTHPSCLLPLLPSYAHLPTNSWSYLKSKCSLLLRTLQWRAGEDSVVKSMDDSCCRGPESDSSRPRQTPHRHLLTPTLVDLTPSELHGHLHQHTQLKQTTPQWLTTFIRVTVSKVTYPSPHSTVVSCTQPFT